MQFWLLFLWLVGLTAAFCAAFFVLPRIPSNRTIGATLLIAAVARFVPILLYPHAEGLFALDIQNMEQTAEAVRNGNDIYREPYFLHPYLPFQMYVLAAMSAMADATNTPFFVWVRVPQAAADAGTAALLVLGSRQLGFGERAAWRNGLLYAVCPLAVAVTVYHGQFDAISVFSVFGALVLLLRRPPEVNWSAFSIGLAVLQKLWPLFLFPLFAAAINGWERRLHYVAISFGLVAVSVVVYVVAFGSSFRRVYDNVFRYQTPFPDSAGIILVLDRLPDWIPWRDSVMEWWIAHGEWPAAIAVAAVTVFLIVSRRSPVVGAIGVLCTLYVLFPDNGQYHYLWIVPFGLAARHYLPVALVVLTTTGVYFVLGFLGYALRDTPLFEGAVATWIVERWWILPFVTWLTFVGWGAWAILGHDTQGVRAISSGGLAPDVSVA